MPRNYTPSKLKIISHDPDQIELSYTVDEIKGHQGKGPNYKYLVKWKGYTAKDNTWEPATQFDNRAEIDWYWSQAHWDKRTKDNPTTRKGRKGGDVVNNDMNAVLDRQSLRNTKGNILSRTQTRKCRQTS